MVKRFFYVIVLVIAFTGCIKNRSDEYCQYDACAYKAPASEIEAIQKFLSGQGITATQHCSGLFYNIENAGTGATPGICSLIGVKYKGMLTNGNVFDEQTNPFYFQLGRLIEGWKAGLTQIKQGGKMKLYVPPSLGYGSRDFTDQNGNVLIPAHSILVFDIELVTVE